MNNSENPNNIVTNSNNTNPSVMPSTPPSNLTPTQMPSTMESNVPTPMQVPSSSQVPLPENNMVSEVPNVPSGNQEVTVVNTEKKRTSSFIMIILIVLLILFVFNIDKVIEYYDNYTQTGSLTSKTNNESTNNLDNGYILIGDNTSRIQIDKIIFYNFRKKEDESLITFNYETSSRYSDSASLNIYIELYNADKEIIFKSLFDTSSELEKDTVRIYSINVTSDVLQDAYYALVKKYTNEELQSTQTLTCKYNDVDGDQTLNYNIIYNFKNNGLTNYIVNKQIFNVDENSQSYINLENEYNLVSQTINAVFEGGNLNYTVNLDSDLNGFSPLYNSGTIITVIKNKEKLKKWDCE